MRYKVIPSVLADNSKQTGVLSLWQGVINRVAALRNFPLDPQKRLRYILKTT